MPTEVESTDAPECTGFACALCGKSFARRDLRNRHRRRCEKSIGKIRVSKKRSCEACGKSKLKCDLQQPSCSRCQSRSMPCHYPNDTAAQAAQQNALRNASITSIASDLTYVSDDFLTNGFHASAPSTASLTGYNTPIHMNHLTGQQSPVFATVMDDMLFEGMPLDSEAFSRSSAGFWDSSAAGMLAGDLNLTDPFSQTCNMTTDFPMTAFSSLTEDIDFSSSTKTTMSFFGNNDMQFEQQLPIRPASSCKQDDSFPGSVFDFDTPTSTSPAATVPDNLYSIMSNTLAGVHMSSSVSEAMSMTRQNSTSPSSPENSVSNFDFSDDPTQSLPTPAMSRNPSMSSLDHLSLQLQSGYRFMFSIEEAATIICDYPQEMLDRSYSSPFVHSRLQHGSESGLPEPIAVALCCVSAKSQSVESSLPFVCKMIDSQREQLINDFPRKQLELDDTSSYLHALCIYQIESMLALRKSRPRNAILSAELHHNFLLKMARTAFRSKSHLLCNLHSQQLDHRSWAAAESLRRNLFLVNMINDLSFATKALNGHYYEPLEEEYLTDLPLPAPEAMWKSTSPADWTKARDAAAWTGEGILTLGKAMSKLNRGEDLGDLEPLQKLVISCAWRRFKAA